MAEPDEVAAARLAEHENRPPRLLAPRDHLRQRRAVDPRIRGRIDNEELAVVQRGLHRGALDLEVLHYGPYREKDQQGEEYGLSELPYKASELHRPARTGAQLSSLVQEKGLR